MANDRTVEVGILSIRRLRLFTINPYAQSPMPESEPTTRKTHVVSGGMAHCPGAAIFRMPATTMNTARSRAADKNRVQNHTCGARRPLRDRSACCASLVGGLNALFSARR